MSVFSYSLICHAGRSTVLSIGYSGAQVGTQNTLSVRNPLLRPVNDPFLAVLTLHRGRLHPHHVATGMGL